MNDSKNEENHRYYMGQAFINLYPNVNYKEIENIIKSLKLKNSCGYDITHYFKNKFAIYNFNDKLYMQSNVKGRSDIWDVSNFRPISLLTSFSKIFETIILSRVGCMSCDK
jgi:hypothetical protein